MRFDVLLNARSRLFHNVARAFEMGLQALECFKRRCANDLVQFFGRPGKLLQRMLVFGDELFLDSANHDVSYTDSSFYNVDRMCNALKTVEKTFQ